LKSSLGRMRLCITYCKLRMLTYADECSRILTYADAQMGHCITHCKLRMLTYPDEC
jgi:hypothetical protein